MYHYRYVFLDVDGVLNHPQFYQEWRARRNAAVKTGEFTNDLEWHADPKKLELLNQLKGSQVVLITSWDHDKCSRILPQLGLELPIIGGVKAREIQYRWLVRGNSIAEWFVEHFGDAPRDSFIKSFKNGWWYPHEVYDMVNGKLHQVEPGEVAVTYVILDDSADMLMDQKDHFVKVNPGYGLREKDVARARKILNLE